MGGLGGVDEVVVEVCSEKGGGGATGAGPLAVTTVWRSVDVLDLMNSAVTVLLAEPFGVPLEVPFGSPDTDGR